MAIKFQDSLEVKGGSASKIYLEGAGGTGSSTILQAYNPDDGAGHAGGTAYLKSSGWGEAQLAVGSYRWTQAGGKMTVTGGVYYFNTGNVGIGTGSPSSKLTVAGRVDFQNDLRLRGTDSSANQGVVRFYVDDSNKLYIDTANDGNNQFSIDSSGNVGIGITKLSQGNSAGVLKITTSHGWTNIGAANGSWSHFDTDRTQFYFGKPTEFNGTVKPYQHNSYDLGSSSKQWDGIYGRYIYQNGTQVIATRAEVHSRLYSTGGNADDYTEFGIYRNYAEGGPIPSHNTILNVMQQDGRYGFQLGANTLQEVDGLFYRSKDANIGPTWYQVASRDWVSSQGYITSSHTHSAADITSGTLGSARLSGTYGINVTGYSNALYHRDNRIISPSEDSSRQLRFGFTSFNNDNSAPWADYLHLRSYGDASGGNDNLVMFSKDGIEMRIWQQSWNSEEPYALHRDVAFKDELQTPAITSNGTTPSLNSGITASEVRILINAQESGSYLTSVPNHSAALITSGTLDGARLPWQTNDGFTGTYPIVWKATGSLEPFTSSWLNVNGSTDTLQARNIHADGKITSTESITVNNTTSICVAHWSRGNDSTGAIKIKLPGLHSASNWSMVVLRITTYEYNSNEHTVYYVSGHDWVSGWYNKKVTIIGETDKLLQLAYSDDANEDYVIIGDVDSFWQYGHVTVDVMAHPSFYHSSMDITEGWTIEQTEDLAGITLQPTETKRVANQEWVNSQGYLTSFDITTQTDPKYLRSDTSDTMNGNLLVASQTQTNATSKAEMLSNAVAKFKPHAQNSGSLAIAQVDSGNAVGMQFTNGAGTADWDIALQPFGGRVGIGTATPAAALDVDGTAQMSTGITENTHYVGVSVQHWGDGGTGMYFNADSVDIRTNSIKRIEFNNSGVSIPSDVYFTGNSRKIYLTGGDTNSQNGWIVGEQDRYGFGTRWNSSSSLEFEGWWNKEVTSAANRSLGSVNVDSRIWNFSNTVRVNGYDVATQAWVEEQPPAPAAASCAVVGDTIEVSFDPAPESPDYYQVWASQDGGSYSLIAQIPTQDFSPFMTVIDTSFSVSGLRAYRVYAVRRGIYSDPATTSRTYTQSALEPIGMDVVPMEESFFVQWDAPQSRFVDHYEVYLDTHADQGSLNRNNASLVYSGNNTFYMHRASTNEFHQFWVEIAES
jgi:hypothetical protein